MQKYPALLLIYIVLIACLPLIYFPIQVLGTTVYNLEHYWHDSDDANSGLKNEHPSATTSLSAAGFNFTTSSSWALGIVSMRLEKVASPTANLTCALFTENATKLPAEPALAWSNHINSSSLSASASYVNFSFVEANYTLATSTSYFICVIANTTNVDGTNFVRVHFTSNTTANYGRVKFASNVWTGLSASYDCQFYVYSFTDVDAPKYHDIKVEDDGINKDAADSCWFAVNWTAESGNLSHYIFEHNNTGTLANGSVTAFTSGVTTAYSNSTISSLNTTGGLYLSWRYYANNTDDAWNVTALQYTWIWKPFPKVVERALGETQTACRQAIYYNATTTGGADAVYVCYLNSTSQYYETSAYNCLTGRWTDRHQTVFAGHSDGHWQPSLTIVGDFLCMLYGYFDVMSYRLSNNSVKTTADLDALVSEWGIEHEIPKDDQPDGWSYPNPIYWTDNKTILVMRDGDSQNSAWDLFTWENLSYSEYVDSCTNTTVEWTETGAHPYLTDSDANDITGVVGTANQSEFTFPDISTSTGIIYNATLHLEVNVVTTNDLKVYYNTSISGGWVHLATPTATVGYIWRNFTVQDTVFQDNATIFNSFELLFEDANVNPAPVVRRAFLSVTYTDWNQTHDPFIEFSDDNTTLYMMHPTHVNGNLLLSYNKYNYSTASRTNVYSFYSDDNADSWKELDGTSLSVPINANIPLIQTYAAECRGATSVLDENNIPIVGWYWSSGVGQREFYAMMVVANDTVGNPLSWTTYNCTYNSNQIWANSYHQQFFDPYYERPSFWGLTNDNKRVAKFVKQPDANNWRLIWEDDDHDDVFYRQIIIQHAPEAFEILTLERVIIVGNGTESTTNQNGTWNTYIYGCRFNASFTGSITTARLFANWSSGACQSEFAIYYYSNLTLVDTTYTDFICSGAVYSGWSNSLSWENAPTVFNGTEYIIFFRGRNLIILQPYFYHYYDNNSIVNRSALYPLDYETAFPATLTGGSMSYRNFSMNIIVEQSLLNVRGVGDRLAFNMSEPATASVVFTVTTTSLSMKTRGVIGGVTFTASLTGMVATSRTATAILQFSASLAEQIQRFRTATANVVFTATSEAFAGVLRSVSSGLVFTASALGVQTLERSLSSGITFVASVASQVGRTATATANLVYTATVVGVARLELAVSAILQFTASTELALSITRGVNAILSFATEVSRSVTGDISRFATRGFVLAAVLLGFALIVLVGAILAIFVRRK